MEREKIDRVSLRARGLAVLRGVLETSAARDFLALLDLLARDRPDLAAVAEGYGRLWEELVREPDRLLPDAWRSYLLGRLLDDENPFSLGAERGEVGPEVLEQARRDLRVLRELFEFDAEAVLRVVEDVVPGLAGSWVPWQGPEPAGDAPRRVLARKLAAARDWGVCAELLAEHFARHGAGPFGRYRAFRYDGGLQAVPDPDPVRLSGLVGYEREREPLIENTERFLAGLPAHHALLYGLPGTGKSSTVKAILNEYAGEGLRLVELSKEDLGSLPQVLGVLRGRAPRFVLFVDDLSFEEHEVEYKSLKALLEGSVEEPPENVRLYATSNRRNLIRERFTERDERAPDGTGSASDDVHARDTMQEKLSLAARFGLRVTFPAPDQRRYIEIVAGLAGERGIEMPEAELVERALLWDRWHAGRSGRTARQFVDEIEAELGHGPDSSR
ncbi:MAG TPA: ATP-binding protein [Rubrobacteraceae bacterium]|nr:ATP-binding protein [Rubrobacteraceae bacterium]